MKYIYELLADTAYSTGLWFKGLHRFITRKPAQRPSLLALNVDWFTHCNWRDQLIAFKQIDSYRSYKH